jgi:hypothetical protein
VENEITVHLESPDVLFHDAAQFHLSRVRIEERLLERELRDDPRLTGKPDDFGA